MTKIDRTQCIVMKFKPGRGPAFEWVSSLVERRVVALPHVERHVMRPQPGCLVIDLDGSRVMVAMANNPPCADVVIAVGPSCDLEGTDILRSQRAAFCTLLCEAIKVHFPSGDVLQSRVTGRPDVALAAALLEAARLHSAEARVVAISVRDDINASRENLRSALYAPVHRSDLGAGAPSLAMRAAIGTMTTVVTVASLPVGLALLAANASGGASLRLTAAAMAGVGMMQAVFGISAFPMI